MIPTYEHREEKHNFVNALKNGGGSRQLRLPTDEVVLEDILQFSECHEDDGKNIHFLHCFLS